MAGTDITGLFGSGGSSTGMGVLSSVISLFEGIDADEQASKLAKKLSDRRVTLPSSAYESFGVAKENLNAGLPGGAEAGEKVLGAQASTINNMRKMAKSPSSLADFAARSASQTNDFFKNLAVEEANKTFQNKELFMNAADRFTQEQLGVQKENIGFQTDAMMEKAQDSKNLLQSVENAAGKLTTTANIATESKAQDDYMKMLEKYLFGDQNKKPKSFAEQFNQNVTGDPSVSIGPNYGSWPGKESQQDPATMARKTFDDAINNLFGD